jgi:deoxyribose-phosphate aldolase
MRRVVGPNVGVKAAGGVRSLEAMLQMLAAGACRVGATATAAIGAEWRAHGQKALKAALAAQSAADRGKGPSARDEG